MIVSVFTQLRLPLVAAVCCWFMLAGVRSRRLVVVFSSLVFMITRFMIWIHRYDTIIKSLDVLPTSTLKRFLSDVACFFNFSSFEVEWIQLK